MDSARSLSTAQELLLRLLEETSDNLDGRRVATDLRQNLTLWRSMLFTRLGDLAVIGLRDLEKNHVHYDTVFLLPEPGEQVALERLVAEWHADEVEWIALGAARRMLGGPRATAPYGSDPERVILRCWWD